MRLRYSKSSRAHWALLLIAALCIAAGCNGSSPSSREGRFKPPGAVVPPMVKESRRLGPLPPDRAMSVQVMMPDGSDLQASVKFLQQQNFQVIPFPAVGLLSAQGRVRDVNATFGVQLSQWRHSATGETFFATDQAPTLPFKVDGIFGLDNAVRPKPFLWNGCNQITGNCHGLKAEQLRKAYNATDQGSDGGGQRVAIFASSSGVSMDAIHAFDLYNKLPFTQINVHRFSGYVDLQKMGAFLAPGADFGPKNDDFEYEAELDVETVHAMAPGAAIDLYEMGRTDDPNLADQVTLFLMAATTGHDHVASISYSACESLFGSNVTQYAEFNRRLLLGSQMSVFASTGDTGKYCSGNGSYPEGAAYPASDPLVTAVGGTHLELKSDDTLNSEQAWNGDPFAKWKDTGKAPASGGGRSSQFSRPDWQGGPALPTWAAKRMVPDVAADADPDSGLAISIGQDNVTFEPIGGTSMSAPIWAGVAARYDTAAAAAGAPLLGFANPLLYKLASHNKGFFDVITDQNGGWELAGHAVVGWDAATGLGTPNVASLITDGLAQSLIVFVDGGAQPPANAPARSQTGGPVRFMEEDGTELAHYALTPGAAVIGAAGKHVFIYEDGGLLKGLRPDGSLENLGSLGVDRIASFAASPDGRQWIWVTANLPRSASDSALHIGGIGLTSRVVTTLHPAPTQPATLRAVEWDSGGPVFTQQPDGVGGRFLYDYAPGKAFRLDPTTLAIASLDRPPYCVFNASPNEAGFDDLAPDGSIACSSQGSTATPVGSSLRVVHADGSILSYAVDSSKYGQFGAAYFNPKSNTATLSAAGLSPSPQTFDLFLINTKNLSKPTPFGPPDVTPALRWQSWLPDGSLVVSRPDWLGLPAELTPATYLISPTGVATTLSTKPVGCFNPSNECSVPVGYVAAPTGVTGPR